MTTPATPRAARLIAECATAAARHLAGDDSPGAILARALFQVGQLQRQIELVCAEHEPSPAAFGIERTDCRLPNGTPAVLGYRWDTALLKATAVECWVGGQEVAALLNEDVLYDLAKDAAERHIDDILAQPDDDPGYDERGQYRAPRRSDARADVELARAA